MKILHKSFPLSFIELNLIDFVGSENVVRALIELGANVLAENLDGKIPLHVAREQSEFSTFCPNFY